MNFIGETLGVFVIGTFVSGSLIWIGLTFLNWIKAIKLNEDSSTATDYNDRE